VHGFTWVRIDRTADRTAPLKRLGRGCGESELWALGLVVRLKLTMAARFPDGIARLTADDLALELDVPDEAVHQLLQLGYLHQTDDGLAYSGWQDDPAVRDLLARRKRASRTGSLPTDCPQTAHSLPTADRQPVGHTVQNSTVQNSTGHDRTLHDPEPGTNEAQLPAHSAELAGLVLSHWPADKRCHPRQVLMAIRQDQGQPDAWTCRQIGQSASRWVAAYTEQGRMQYLPRLDNWIAAGSWRSEPPAAPAGTGAGRARTRRGEVAVTPEDMRAIILKARQAEAHNERTGDGDQ